MIDDSEYGLAATVWGKDVARAEALADRLDVGTVWVNQIIVLHPDIAFGGHKVRLHEVD
jgi:acyl-CoA reductase-like NAD-dependent aldehyde dehydrogenase